VIDDLKAVLEVTPLIKEDPLESMSLFPFIEEYLFASCHTRQDSALCRIGILSSMAWRVTEPCREQA
jgi:hypothetical protein